MLHQSLISRLTYLGLSQKNYFSEPACLHHLSVLGFRCETKGGLGNRAEAARSRKKVIVHNDPSTQRIHELISAFPRELSVFRKKKGTDCTFFPEKGICGNQFVDALLWQHPFWDALKFPSYCRDFHRLTQLSDQVVLWAASP